MLLSSNQAREVFSFPTADENDIVRGGQALTIKRRGAFKRSEQEGTEGASGEVERARKREVLVSDALKSE